jgi:hypothetical protein
LVAFVLIGLVLSFAQPKIEELQDEAVIDQSIKMIREIDYVIQEVFERGIGNKREIQINLKEGDLTIDSQGNSITFELEGRFMYSQPGQEYSEGGLDILTEQTAKGYSVRVRKSYDNLDFTYNLKEDNKILTQSSTPYTIFITNKGETINFEVE